MNRRPEKCQREKRVKQMIIEKTIFVLLHSEDMPLAATTLKGIRVVCCTVLECTSQQRPRGAGTLGRRGMPTRL